MRPEPNRFTPLDYRRDIDGLRGIAVLAVIGFHAFPKRVPGGFVGVDVFFVISGFLITALVTRNLARGTFRFRDFYERRIRRIFPALVTVLAVTVAVGWLTLLSDEYRQLGRHVAGGAGFIGNFLLWREAGYFDAPSEMKPLLHLWSLAIEEQFYLVWPVVLWVVARWPRSTLAVTLFLATASFLSNVSTLGTDPSAAFYLPHTRIWELLAGAVLVTLAAKGAADGRAYVPTWLSEEVGLRRSSGDIIRPSTRRSALSWLGAVAIVYGIFCMTRSTPVPGPWTLIPVLGTVLVIAAGPAATLNRSLLARPALVGLGLISFPLYLWHWPLLAFARVVESRTPDVAVRLAAIAVAVLLAYLTFRIIERPIRFGPNGGLKAVGLIVLMACVGGGGYLVRARDGLPGRTHIRTYDDQQRALFAWSRALGRPPGAKVMLIGDSHAVHLVPGFTKEFGPLAADYASAGCIPFFGVDRYDRSFVPGTCVKAMTEALTLFESSADFRVVVHTSNAPHNLTAQPF
jgi:peptidoglycan/LPS O-acetylase OafA/YrhL